MNFMKAAAELRQKKKEQESAKETARYNAVVDIRRDIIEFFDNKPGHQIYIDFATRDNGTIDCKFGKKEFTISSIKSEEFSLKTSDEAPQIYHDRASLGVAILDFLS